jgi:hypothetical protein
MAKEEIPPRLADWGELTTHGVEKANHGKNVQSCYD